MNWASIIKKSNTRDVFRGRDAEVGSAFTIKNYPEEVDEWVFDRLDIVLEFETQDRGLESFSNSCTASIEGTLIGFMDESEENIRTEKIEIEIDKEFDMYFDISVEGSSKEQKNTVIINFVNFSISDITIDFKNTKNGYSVVGAMDIEFEVASG
jgi:hypothetical protein